MKTTPIQHDAEMPHDPAGSQEGFVGKLKAFHQDASGTTTMEYGLLLAAIALPSYFIIRMTLFFLLDYYQMTTALNALPFP